MKYDFIEKRDQLVKDRLLRCDDLGDLRVYSYVNWCKDWDEITLNSRGVIYNRATGETVSLPFPKFFNMDKRQETQEHNLPWHDGFRIFKKYDGWLGILYRYDGQHRIATRGSFKSVGALWATEFLKKYDLSGLPDEVTLLFEIICPATHIVVNYGDYENLILLAAYNRNTGKEYGWEQVKEWSHEFGFTLVESYDQNWLGYCRGQIKTVSGDELEGFVIRFNNGLRVKIKSEDYFRRSSLLMGLTYLNIWATLVDGIVPVMIWEQVGADYHDKLKKIAQVLEQKYLKIILEIEKQFDEIDDQSNRATFAKEAKNMSHQHAMFSIFDGHNERVDEYIMKLIRPHNNVINKL